MRKWNSKAEMQWNHGAEAKEEEEEEDKGYWMMQRDDGMGNGKNWFVKRSIQKHLILK